MRGVTPHAVQAIIFPVFQSTLPMRGVTSGVNAIVNAVKFQSTLPMRGVTTQAIQEGQRLSISIHTPHAGSDCNFNQKLLLSFSQNQQMIFFYLLLFPFFPPPFPHSQTKSKPFVHFFRCESPWLFLFASDSHPHAFYSHSFLTVSMYRLPQFLYQHLHALPLFYICFPSSKISDEGVKFSVSMGKNLL